MKHTRLICINILKPYQLSHRNCKRNVNCYGQYKIQVRNTSNSKMLARNIIEILLVISAIELGSSLVCYQCEGKDCSAEPKDMETCNSNEFCYLTKDDRGSEMRGCESTETCFASRARRGGQFQHFRQINGISCQICNQRLCNSGINMGLGSRTAVCYKCEGDECKGDEESMATCESSSCFFARADGVEKRGCGQISFFNAASSAFQFTCSTDKCNNDKSYGQTQVQSKELQEQMKQLGNRLRDDQMNMQRNFNEHMRAMGDQMKHLFSNIDWMGR